MISAAKPQGGFVILISFVVALTLMMMPLPEWAEPARPQWLLMAVIYWCIALPNRVGVIVAWIMGLVLDVATGALLGQNALGFAIVGFLAIKLHLRIRLFPLWQQALSVLILIALYQIVSLWVTGFTGQSAQSWTYWFASLTSMLLWPFVFTLLRGVRRFYRVR
ncbi:MAG: rod shape-determining protein MreD [Gammaproteobacteria bacterium]